MGYFDDLEKAREELDEKAQNYLNQFDFMATTDMCERIWDKGWEILKKHKDDYESIPELYKDAVTCIGEGSMPYLDFAKRPGSFNKTLGLSLVSVDAHLRNLLEILEGRTDKELDFGLVAKVSYPEKTKNKGVKKSRKKI